MHAHSSSATTVYAPFSHTHTAQQQIDSKQKKSEDVIVIDEQTDPFFRVFIYF